MTEALPRALTIANRTMVFDNSGKSHRLLLEVADHWIAYLANELPTWLGQQMSRIAGGLQAQREMGALAPPPAAPRLKRPRSLTSVLNSLRPAEPQARQPWEPALVAMAERIRAFEAKAAEMKATPKQPKPEPDQPRPRSGPRP